MTGATWLCEDHYQHACREAGYNLPQLLVINIIHAKCEAAGCIATADHLVEKRDDGVTKPLKMTEEA
jgi:hypothetical protein